MGGCYLAEEDGRKMGGKKWEAINGEFRGWLNTRVCWVPR